MLIENKDVHDGYADFLINKLVGVLLKLVFLISKKSCA
jgi:hypothetical protein